MEKDTSFDEKMLKEMTLLERKERRLQDQAEAVKKIVEDQSYTSVNRKFERNFDGHLKEFISLMNQLYTKYDTHLMNLLTRLDYDGFYSQYLYQPVMKANLNISNTTLNLSGAGV
jgi:hypothetical protein